MATIRMASILRTRIVASDKDIVLSLRVPTDTRSRTKDIIKYPARVLIPKRIVTM